LQRLLEGKLQYDTTIVELSDVERAQTQLEHAIVEFTRHKAKRNNLVTLYYTGHGSHDESTGDLIFHAWIFESKLIASLGTDILQKVRHRGL